MARRNPLIRPIAKANHNFGPPKSKGILDDFSVRKVSATKEAEIQAINLSGDKLGIGTADPQWQMHLHEGSGNFGIVKTEGFPTFLMVSASSISNSHSGHWTHIRSGGTWESPTATQDAMLMGDFGFRGHDGTNFLNNDSASIRCTAVGNFTATARGANLQFRTTKTGTTNTQIRLSIEDDGAVLIGDRTNMMRVDNNGDVVFENGAGLQFGELWVADGVTAQSIATGVTYTKLTGWANDGQENGGIDNDVANNKIIINKVGKYLINCSINGASGSNNTTFKFAVFLNAVEQDKIHMHRKFASGGDKGSGAMTGIIDVTTVPWDLDVRARHDNGGAVNFTPSYMNINCVQIGGT